MKFFEVALAQNNLFPLTYSSDLDLEVGDIVIIPIRNKESLGIIIKTDLHTEISEYKSVIKKLLLPKIKQETILYYQKIASYYLSEIGSIIKLVLPVDLHKVRKSKKGIFFHVDKVQFNLQPLSESQLDAFNSIKDNLGVSVLRGVTGSGKTEVYFHLAAEHIMRGNQVLILIPEIALTTQVIERFKERFGFEPIIWHSSISESQKKHQLSSIISGDAKLIIGTRSALLLPYPKLKLIIVDEEHDSSYKQDSSPVYNARDMAVMRGYIEKFPVLLCSATPSIETLHNAISRKYKLIELTSRFGNASLPEIHLVDMRKEKLTQGSYLSKKLLEAMRNSLSNGNQALLFLNRRGYAPLMICKSCGHRYVCKSCSAWMIYHKFKKRLECHHCGDVRAVKHNCPDCDLEDSHIPCGPGVERIYEEVSEIFPEYKIQLMTKENMQKPAEIQTLIQNILEKKVDIIIGTQIVTKGYHFPNLNFVGIVDADIGILGEDLKSPERSFQLLQQVSGRAGREATKGLVYIQSYMPENLAIKSMVNMDSEAFIEYEMAHRMEYKMPPFSRMASIIISGKNELQTLEYASGISKLAPKSNDVKILGPSAAIMSKLQGKYRFRLIVYAAKTFPLQEYIKEWFLDVKQTSRFFIKIDIDPYSLY